MKPKFADSDATRERGIALVAVLWILALLATLVLGFVFETRMDLRIARNSTEAGRARAIADAGVTLAILGVFDPAPATQWRGDGRVHELSYDGGTIRVSVEDEDGKLDLNAAPITALRNLFQALGVGDPDQLADAIARQRASVAKTDATSTDASNPSTPRAFFATDELRNLPGVTPAVYARISRFVTAYTGSASINPMTASAEVLRSLPGAQPAQIDAFIAARSQAGTPGASLPQLGGIAASQTSLRVFTIVAQARSPNGARFVRSAVVTLTGVPDAPYRFLTWAEGARDPVANTSILGSALRD